jgi:hypothetical protein
MGRGLDLLITKVRRFQLLELVVVLLLLLVQLVRIGSQVVQLTELS